VKPRLSRPLVTAIVTGALVAGGAVYTSPASAAGSLLREPTASESASASPSESASESTSPSPSESASESTSPSPSASVSPSDSVSPSPTTSPSPSQPPADTTAPTGTFQLTAGALWLGQNLVLSQKATEFSDDKSADNEITRKITWGDGTTTTMYPGWVTVNKKFARTGKFNVTITLTDKAGNSRVVGPKSVSVTNAAKGSYSLGSSKAYQGQRFQVKVNKLPAGATGYVIDWADGSTSYHAAKTKSVRGFINFKIVNGKQTGTRISGVRTIRISPVNKNGATLYQYAGKINILKDNWKPKFTITKPGNASKASSWKTVRGTASDKGAGLLDNKVAMAVYRVTTSGAEYCLNRKRQWKRVYTDEQYNACFQTKNIPLLTVKKGKWSLTLPSVSKGYIFVSGIAQDYAGRYTLRSRSATLTR
jgi:hypothetical protein